MARIIAPRILLNLFVLPTLLALCFGTPPFNVADEISHFARIQSILLGDVVPRRVQVSNGVTGEGGSVDASFYQLLGAALPLSPALDFHSTPIAAVEKAALVSRQDRPVNAIFSNTAIYAPALYLPSMAAIAVAKVVSRRPLFEFYAGRVVNALCCYAILSFVVRRAPNLGLFAVAAASVPTVAFQVASLSADALMMPAVIGFASLLATLPGEGGGKRPVALALATIFIAIGKVAYVPLAALPVLVSYLSERKRSRRTEFLAGALALAVALWAAWAWIVHDKVYNDRPEIHIDPAGQLAFVAGHIGRFLAVGTGQFHAQWRYLLLSTFGYRLGWGTAPVPTAVTVAAAAGLVASATTTGLRQSRIATALVVAICAACGAGIVGLLYLQYNAVGASGIEGMQGRYFLPLVIVCVPWLTGKMPSLARWGQVAAGMSTIICCVYLVAQIPRWWTV